MYRLDVADGIATVTFDRPPVNAQNRQTREEAIRLFDALSDRDDVRVVILTGAGKVFSAGADVKEHVGLVQQPGDYVRHMASRSATSALMSRARDKTLVAIRPF